MKSKKTIITALLLTGGIMRATAQTYTHNYIDTSGGKLWMNVLYIIATVLMGVAVYQFLRFKRVLKANTQVPLPDVHQTIQDINAKQIGAILDAKGSKDCCGDCKKTGGGSCSRIAKAMGVLLLALLSQTAMAQTANDKPLLSQPGIIITLVLLAIPLLLAAILIINRAIRSLKKTGNEIKEKRAGEFAEILKSHGALPKTDSELEERKHALEFALQNNELSGGAAALDGKGLIQNISDKHEVHFTAVKKKAAPRPALDADITKMILWYLGCAAFWLLVGSGIGEYVGVKFVMPDADHVSWLSFGRLRPVHTNMVFWGWASLGIMGLGYYVVPTVSNTKLHSVKWGWWALVLTNMQVVLGTISLMSGVNNGGGEFREYIWPIMALFAVALILTAINFIRTVAKRKTKEIYISNWYIVCSLIFTIIVATTAYLPFWQDGLGETIIQGYYMHSGVGMWFTLFTLGLLYYFIPQQINKPVYAYSLGILAFWTQILFYTIIGTHHFVFSAIPWWLQTVAIVGSMGMIIPVVAATVNFGMTFKGQGDKVSNSYTLPFFLTAVVYYFVVSMQGTAEAFRFTNQVWHFTDFTVAHSHLGFYGIITFAIWGGTYAIVPRLTGKEPPQHLVGAHFWIAFIGLLLYCVPLMIGGTIKGMMWVNGEPFINSVVKMFDYWLWRAIGGSLMFISHGIYFYNFYRMTAKGVDETDIAEEAFRQLEKTRSLTISK